MRVSISACLITRKEPLLRQALESIRPWVDEIVVVDTTPEAEEASFMDDDALHLIDRFERFTDCLDDDGNMADFSAARTRSFELATHPTVLWLDADDVVEGGEHLQAEVARAARTAAGRDWRLVCPYAYEHNDRGECISYQMRERVVPDKARFRWDEPVHEALIPAFGQESLNVDTVLVRWVHKRTRPVTPGRNLRILRARATALLKAGEELPLRLRFYLGTELAKVGDHLKALQNLTAYIELSGWEEERVLACLQVIDILTFYPGSEAEALRWAQRIIDIRPEWPDGYFAVAKIAYRQAAAGGDSERRHLERAAHFGAKGLRCGVKRSPITSNPIEQSVNVPLMLQDVYRRLGRVADRVAMLTMARKARPGDAAIGLLLRECVPRVVGALDIVIACGETREAWSPTTAAASGIGGSETAVIEVSRRLAAAGHRVRVFCNTPEEGLFDRVEYRSLGSLEDVTGCDLLIAWRDALPLEWVPGRVKWLWVHDTTIHNARPWSLHSAGRVLALSQWHAQHLTAEHGVEWEKVAVTRNGIDLARFAHTPARHEHRVIYSSSPDRGLEQLLDAWPAVRATVPDAELHVFYGWQMLEDAARREPDGAEANFLRVLQQKLAALADAGVVVRGRVDQTTLAREMLAAGAWVHPSTMPNGEPFTETSCIGAMEAQAAGCVVVYRPVGALPETVREGIRVDELETLGSRLALALAPISLHERQVIQARVSDAGWDGVVEQWLAWAQRDLARPIVESVRDERGPTIHLVLAPEASGGIIFDPTDPGAVAMGGGCRDGFLGLVREFGRRHYRVRAFSTFTHRLAVKDGVEYVSLADMRGHDKPDVLLAYYDTSPLVGQTGMLRIASHHTYQPYAQWDWADVHTAPSQHAVDYLRERFEPHTPWRLLENGVAIDIARRPVRGRVIYHTSPDRGLHHLLAMWPEIRSRVPGATLHVVGDVAGHIEATKHAHAHHRARERGRMLADGLAAAEGAGGVTLVGRLPRAALDRELAEASVFAFPCSVSAPCETFSVSLMESCRIGLPVVLAPADALRSIYTGGVAMTSGPAEECLGEFRDLVVEALENPSTAARLSHNGHALASRFTFRQQADQLDAIIREFRPGLFRSPPMPRPDRRPSNGHYLTDQALTP
jgi:glycosyltransferase involved in cell wall biosynthesis